MPARVEAPHVPDLKEARFYSRGVAITGLGIVSGLGNDADTAYRNAIAGKSAIVALPDRIIGAYPQINVHVGGLVENYDPKERLKGLIKENELPFLHRSAQYNLDVAFQALKQADLVEQYTEKRGVRTVSGWRFKEGINPEDVVIIGGTGVGGAPEQAIDTQRKLDAGQTADWEDVFKGLVGRVTTPIPLATGPSAQDLRPQGGVITIVAECGTFNSAMGVAMDKIRQGKAKIAVVAVAEEPFIPVALAQFDKITALSREKDPNKTPRALDAGASGFVMAQAAAAFVIEDMDFARQRSANILAVAKEYAERGDAFNISLPHPEGRGLARAIEVAVSDAGGLRKDGEVLYHGHLTGTAGDEIELRAFVRALGENARDVYINGTKPEHGHSLSASTGVEGVLDVMTLQNGIIPPTIKSENPLLATEGYRFVRNEAKRAEVTQVIDAGAGFGGGNAVVIYEAP